MLIGGFQKTSLIDYPGKICSIVFTRGCNFRCRYCHNPDLVIPSQFINTLIEPLEIIDYLKSKKNLVDAVTITGGEPTIQPDLIDFIKQIKDLNYLVKLDTNGTNPHIVQQLIDSQLVDYIAMDIKAPVKKYKDTTQVYRPTRDIQATISILIHGDIDYEFRTTIVESLLSENDILQIGNEIKGAKRYFLQYFRNTNTVDPEMSSAKPLSKDQMLILAEKMKEFVKNCYVREST